MPSPLVLSRFLHAGVLRRAAHLLLLLGILAPATSALALDPGKTLRQYSLDLWDTRAGLPNNTIRAIYRTRDGYLWLGTAAGIVRFDGQDFDLFDKDNTTAINNNDTRAFYEDKEGTLWVGMFGGGLLRFQNGVFERVAQEIDNVSGTMTDIAPGWDGRLWIAGGKGLASFEGGHGRDQSALIGSPTGSVLQLAVDTRSQTLWGAHSIGLFSVKDGRSRFYTVRDGLSNEQTTCLRLSRAGDLWVGTRNGGLNRLRDGRFEVFTTRDGLPSNSIETVVEDRDGNLWIGTTGGLARYAEGRFARLTADQGLPHDAILALHEDGEGSLWIGTDGGLARLKDGVFTAYSAKEGLPSDRVNTVAATRDGAVWLGTSAGLARLQDGRVTVLTTADGLSDDAVLGLHEDRQGRLWVATENGLSLVVGGRPQRHAAIEALNRSASSRYWVRSVIEHRGWLWVVGADTRRIRLSDGVTEVARRKDGRNVQSTCLFADPAGGLRVGSYDGLLTADDSGEMARETLYETKDKESRGVVYAGLTGRDGSLWIATRDQGLFRQREGKLTSYSTAVGLPSNEVSGLAEDDAGNLWIATTRGIARLALKDLDAVDAKSATSVRCVVYGVSDGLKTSEAAFFGVPGAARGSDGRLWFVTKRGVAAVDPRRVAGELPATNVVLRKVVADKQERAPEPGLRLVPGPGDVEIHYAGLSLLAPEKIQFRYRLQGHDEGWVEAGTRRVAYYTRLGARSYTFEVQASNAEGGWPAESETKRLTFSRDPRFTERLVFKLALALVLLAFVGGIYRYRVSALKARELDLARRVEERTADLSREIADHKRTEEKLQSEVAERQRAEDETRQAAERLVAANAELTSNQQALTDKQAALERENEVRRRAEDEARQTAEQLVTANSDLVTNQQALREKQLALERENEDRRRAEEAAGRERDLLHGLMDNIPDLIYFKDADSRYTRVNKALAEALGLKEPQEAAGRNDFDFFTPEFARATREDERELIATGQPVLGKLEQDRRRSAWYLATKVPIRDAAGQITGLVGISKNITERRQAEEQLEHDLAGLLDVVSAVASGDLTRRGQEGEDSIGRIAHSVNLALENFSGILAELRDAAFSVSSSSSQILAAALEIAKGAQYGSDQVNTTSTAVEEMAASMGQVSKNADASSLAAEQVLEHIHEGGQAVNETSQGIARIDTAVTQTAEKMRLLEERSQEIFEIIGLIEELATQSNLLSLNAAIEAAHAGEAGRGFGVVAEEIRRLAERSTEATKDVTGIVKKIVAETRAVLVAMENAMSEVKCGRDLSDRAQRSLREIGTLVERSTQLAGEISSASREQALATQTVANAMQTIANITQESAAGANETTKAVRDLVALSEHLTKAMSRFRIDKPGEH